MKKSKQKDLPYEFWSKYIESDILGREKMIDETMIESIDNTRLMDNFRIRRHCLKLALMGYFDDLIEVMEQKQRENEFRK